MAELTYAFSNKKPGNCSHPNDNNVRNFLNKLNLSNQNLIMMEQVHGDKISWVKDKKTTVIRGVDALISQSSSIILGVKSADCLPILVASPAAGLLGVIHAGWRGLLKRLPQKVIHEFQKHVPIDTVQVIIGPSIKDCCYNILKQRADKFRQEFTEKNFIKKKQQEIYLDLPAVAVQQLQKVGLPTNNIQTSDTCTACNQQYYSYRAGDKGNNLSIITWR